jgi:hypothetical protein
MQLPVSCLVVGGSSAECTSCAICLQNSQEGKRVGDGISKIDLCPTGCRASMAQHGRMVEALEERYPEVARMVDGAR